MAYCEDKRFGILIACFRSNGSAISFVQVCIFLGNRWLITNNSSQLIWSAFALLLGRSWSRPWSVFTAAGNRSCWNWLNGNSQSSASVRRSLSPLTLKIWIWYPNSLFYSSFSSCFGLKFLILVYSVQSTYTDHAEGKRTHSIYTCPPYFETNRASSFKQNLLCLLLNFEPQRLEAKTPFEMSRAFFSVLSGCFYRENRIVQKTNQVWIIFCIIIKIRFEKRYKEIRTVLWYTVSIKTAAATNCADRFNVKKPQ